eukprot:CAMPEP_0198116980 /NCGR_PEP_ID=MMETSP1442-20131203/15927_1 /TAXON_ID= /ORGANISM="Craspedostauros australis, Strain CCMP3328" /LENGTH=200 /DNA_ID=CAMNT_0043774925 /DNA_START=169 /DNA_END=771 /DNA_ORIENTATION=-
MNDHAQNNEMEGSAAPIDPLWLQNNVKRVDIAAEKAYQLIQDFARRYDGSNDMDDDTSTNDNPWKDPENMHVQLQSVRDELNKAWVEQSDRVATPSSKAGSRPPSGDDFRAFYIDLITDAFADSLQSMQESGEEINLDVLADCLQSGIDLYDDRDRDLLHKEFGDFDNDAGSIDGGDGNDDDETGAMTPHRRNQIEAGVP